MLGIRGSGFRARRSLKRAAAPPDSVANISSYTEGVLEETTRDVTLEPLDDWIVVEPLDDSETASGLIVPINEGAQTRQAIVAAVGPDVESIDPGDKVLFPRDAGFEVRLARAVLRTARR